MTKTITLTDITKHFDSMQQYLPTRPPKRDLEQVLKYIERDDYNQMLFDYGETYCLIVLDMFEKTNEFTTCAEIVKQIKAHNLVTNSNYKTRL